MAGALVADAETRANQIVSSGDLTSNCWVLLTDMMIRLW